MRVQPHNYNNVQGWMVTELKLSGGELLVFSAIYGFTQEENQWYTGTRQYLADWTGSTKQTVTKYLKNLVEKGFLVRRERYENGVTFIDYKAVVSQGVGEKITRGVKNNTGAGEKITEGSIKNHLGVGEKITPIINTNKNNHIYTTYEERHEDVTYNVTPTLREEKVPSKEIVSLYHELCPSLPKVRKMTQKRASAITARLRTYGIDEIKECFMKAEKSKFLKGGNDRNWNADFDWLMKESNMAKVLEGKYDNREAPVKQVKNSFNNFEQRTYDYEALEKKLHARGRQNVRHMP